MPNGSAFFLTHGLHVHGLQVSGSILFAILTALLASSKGRGVLTWGFAGFFFPCIALFILFCLDDVRPVPAVAPRAPARQAVDVQAREVAQRTARDREIAGRLAALDVALDVRGNGAPPLPQASPEAIAWYYEESGRPAGPITRSALRALVQAGKVGLDTLIWREGFADWTPLGRLSTFDSAG